MFEKTMLGTITGGVDLGAGDLSRPLMENRDVGSHLPDTCRPSHVAGDMDVSFCNFAVHIAS